MIKRKKQKIISPFGTRIYQGKEQFHFGIDLRSWNFKLWKRQPIIFPERCLVLRQWRDRWGGGIAYQGLETGYFFKSIHITAVSSIIDKGVYEAGEIIGYSEKVKGIDEHEHWEVLIKDTFNYDMKYCKKNWKEFWINPVFYFKERRIKYANKN